jgi:hypothetical protein
MAQKRQLKSRKKHEKRKGLFRPAKNKEVAEIIKINSPENALRSCKDLLNKMVQWVNCAEQRAKAQLRRKNLSAKERREMKEVSKIYHDFKERLKGLKRSLRLR